MREPHPPLRIHHHLVKHAGPDVRCHHHAVRVVLGESTEGQAPAAQSEAIPAVGHPDHHVDHRPRAEPVTLSGGPPGRQPKRREYRCAHVHPADQVDHDVPFGAGLAARRHHRVGDLTERRRLEHLERNREVVALVHRGHGQDVIAVRGGLVEIKVQPHRQIQGFQCLFHCRAVGDRQHRIASADEHRPDLPWAGSRDLLGHEGGRLRTDDQRKPTDASAFVAIAAAQRGAHRHRSPLLPGDAQGAEHAAAGDVEVTRDEVYRVQQVGGQGSVASDAGTQSAVHGSPFSLGQIACQRAHGVRADAGAPVRGLRAEPCGLRSQPVQPVSLSPGPRTDESLGEQHLQDRQEQVRVGIRGDPEPFELGRRLTAPWIDDDDPSAPLDDVVHVVLDPRRGEETPMGHHRIRAEHDQEIRAHQVGNRHRERRAVEELVGQ